MVLVAIIAFLKSYMKKGYKRIIGLETLVIGSGTPAMLSLGEAVYSAFISFDNL
jgi:hypothetical protein